MSRRLENLIVRWLHHLGIPVSSHFVKEKLLSHSDYPSLLSITDALDELGIENAAFVVDKERLNEVPVPFLAHTTAEGGEFILVTDLKKLLNEQPDFNKHWDGVIVAVEKPERWNNAENAEFLSTEKKQKQFFRLTAVLIIIISAISLWNQFSWQYFGLLITSLAGFGVAVLIMQHELGISNELTEQLCAAGKNMDCDAVMHSKGSKIFKWVNWADSGIIYFSSVFLLLTISFLTGTIRSFEMLLALLATCSLPFTLFSVFYQWRIVKKWCPLCLATVVLLWMQFIVLSPAALNLTKGGWSMFSNNTILFAFFLFTVISGTWFQLIKPVLQKNKALTDTNFSLQRIKNNPEIFEVLLQQQTRVATTPFENDLQIGNSEASLKVIIVSNPYCPPCVKAHEILYNLTKRIEMSLTVRFVVYKNNNKDDVQQAVDYILQLLTKKPTSYKAMVLNDWYKLRSLEKFMKEYPLNDNTNIQDQLEELEKWTQENRLTATPTIFINGYKIPKGYDLFDLERIMLGLYSNQQNDIVSKIIDAT